MKRYVLAETAEADLTHILEYIADRDGIGRALTVHQAFTAAFELLASSPGIGSVKPHLTSDAVRWWPVFKFLVAYDATASPLAILRIIHGARDVDAIFIPS